MSRIPSNNLSTYAIQPAMVLVTLAVIGRSKRLIQYFPNSDLKGLALSGLAGSATILASHKVKGQYETEKARSLRVILSFGIGSLFLSQVASKSLKGRAQLSFSGASRFTVLGVLMHCIYGIAFAELKHNERNAVLNPGALLIFLFSAT